MGYLSDWRLTITIGFFFDSDAVQLLLASVDFYGTRPVGIYLRFSNQRYSRWASWLGFGSLKANETKLMANPTG